MAVIDGSFWRRDPAAELRGLTNSRSAGLGLAPVEIIESRDRHVDLAPHLDQRRRHRRRRVELGGDVGDGGHVGGDVLARRPSPRVAACTNFPPR